MHQSRFPSRVNVGFTLNLQLADSSDMDLQFAALTLATSGLPRRRSHRSGAAAARIPADGNPHSTNL